jgi:hypothetical protein
LILFLKAIPPYRANEVTSSIEEKVENSFRENLPLMKNKNIWIIFPNKKHKFDA